MFQKIKKEWARFNKRYLGISNKDHEAEIQFYRKKNLPFELISTALNDDKALKTPIIKNADETVDFINSGRYSLARFGDGEFRLMRKLAINFQKPSAELSKKLLQTLHSNNKTLLVALPDCFSSLEEYQPKVADFWRKWLVKKRGLVYSYLDMDRTYYSAFFTRAYMPYRKTDAQYIHCQSYFEKIKKIWHGRDVLICEGEGTRFGLFNDLLEGANSISRILCPARNAFEKYDEILSSFAVISADKLILLALGPTATVLAFDLHNKGFQAIDIGHLDVEYEWFIKKDEQARPLKYKYVDGSPSGRQVDDLKDRVYLNQIIKKIL
tara:strand:- start:7867 stop:8838 length:972 start_codon:yes stop_codon:yes gene_type:complete